MKRNTIIISVVSALALIGFLFAAYNLTSQPTQSEFPNVTKVLESDHVKWSPERKNVLVEYADFQCPACKTFHAYLKAFEATGSADSDISKKVTFVMRHFPLFQAHPNAQPAAFAAEAAGKQDKFWQMHDLLYDTQDNWSKLPNPNEFFLNLAKQLNLDLEKFKVDMNSTEVKNKVDADIQSGSNAQVNSTPTFFFNGKKLDLQTLDQFKEILRSGTN